MIELIPFDKEEYEKITQEYEKQPQKIWKNNPEITEEEELTYKYGRMMLISLDFGGESKGVM
ncbi:hypothetical protein [Methanosarcina mazei]|uniref:Uncharacterized protein n=1 Tax=Methanosarcina mazei TaxID=2209 RepID=A0A0F8HPY4_METMZ|nr:hypothetical protein [Methanosarcina mazei]KKG79807.1 hypothetical protein DU55_13105 [Methanosarcina mazei]